MGEPKRNNLIDLIKGLLILLVIIGHFLPGTLSENPARYVIYSFHMPAFFFMSGMLYSGHTSLKKYGLRLGIPWLAAVQVYYILTNLKTISWQSYLRAYITPYYHLWFVAGFFFCIVAVKLSKENKRVLLCLGIIFAFLSVSLRGNQTLVWKFIDYTIRPQYLLFFTMGLLAQNKRVGGVLRRAIIPAILFVLFLPFGFRMQENWWEPLCRYLLLCLIFYNVDLWKYNVEPSAISMIGTMTYPIYLWHVIGKIGALYITGREYNLYFYICSGLFVVLLIAFLRINKNDKIRFIVGK